MDPNKKIADRTIEIIASRRIQAFTIAVLVLAVLAVLQVNNLKRNTPMCDLLANANLSNSDLQRIQIALSQSGLSDFRMEENRILVPAAMHPEYLRAVAEKSALPKELQDSDEESRPAVNPFLSRSQQLSLERMEKKHQVRDMVLRLPCVEQAWFEMDKSEPSSAFEQAEQSAVVSIRTPDTIALSDQHVDTVKRMIAGAVAGLDPANIVVIDLSAGFAHQDNIDPSTSQQIHFRRIAFEQQRFYENQIRETLKDYPGIEISVFVDVAPVDSNQVATRIPQRFRPANSQPLPPAGANQFASIEKLTAPQQRVVDQVAFTNTNAPKNLLKKRVSVSIDVPQKLVHDLFGNSKTVSSLATSRANLKASLSNQANAKFAQLQSELVQKVRPILPETSFQNGSTNPITVNLVRTPIVTGPDWATQAKEFAAQNWPSAAVLVIGLLLLSIITRKQDDVHAVHAENRIEDQDELAIHSPTNSATPSQADSEVRLTKLIEKDPDAAAKVIEAWIRDAG